MHFDAIEIVVPTNADWGLFILGPILMIMPALAAWAVVPFAPEVVLANINAGLLYLMALTSMGVYGVIRSIIFRLNRAVTPSASL